MSVELPFIPERRDLIQSLAFSHNNDSEIDGLRELGLELVQRCDSKRDEANLHHCHWHSFGVHWSSVLNPRLNIPAGHRLCREDEQGDLVLYFRKAQAHERKLFTHLLEGHVCVHSGLLLDDGRVESKFTYGNVYRHEVWDVPSSYGEVCRRYAFISKERLDQDIERVWYEGGI